MTMVLDGLEQWGGVPVGSQGLSPPIWGTHWFVDGTNGSDGNSGLSKLEPLATIQAAVTAQIADTTGLGDVIWIFPGTYAETVYAAAISNVSLIGASADSVIIAPTDGHALLLGLEGEVTVSMTNSVLKNITFLTPSTSSTTYAALGIGVMTKSVIEDCKFKGTTGAGGRGAAATIGLQIGNRTTTDWEFHEHSRISRCEFTANAGRTTQLGIGIKVGAYADTNPDRRGFKSMIIEDCLIGAVDRAIEIDAGPASCNGSTIRRNIICGHEGNNGPSVGIEAVTGEGEDQMCMIVSNMIAAANDCIANYADHVCFNNVVSAGGGIPDTEYHDGS